MAAAEFRALLRVLLKRRGMSVPALARACSYSRQYVWEVAAGRKRAPLETIRAFDAALGAQGSLLATVAGDGNPIEEDGDMRRRTVLAGASAVAGNITLGGGTLDELTAALFPSDKAAPGNLAELRTSLARAREDFAAVRYQQLARRLPGLLGAGEAARSFAGPAERAEYDVLLAGAYGLAARLAIKLHEQGVAWVTADRAAQAARRSGDPRAVASADRTAAVLLRRAGQRDQAQRVVVDAAARLHADTNLAGAGDASLYASLLATAAYTAAVADRRDEAWTYAAEAGGVLAAAGGGDGFGANELELYRSGIARALGDYGQAVDHARRVRVGLLPTAERQARCWEDTALAWWGRGRRDEAWEALQAAEVAAPQEVRYRPWAQRLAVDLLESGPALPGLRQFAARVGVPA